MPAAQPGTPVKRIWTFEVWWNGNEPYWVPKEPSLKSTLKMNS
jgi:hypothetical protein